MRSITFILTGLLTLTALAADYPESRREAISQQVDRLVFLFDSLGMEYKPVKD